MNREDIIRMAREAALPTFIVDSSLIMAFCMAIARKSAAAEREECAKVCDSLNFIENGTPGGARVSNRHCAASIRARGEK